MTPCDKFYFGWGTALPSSAGRSAKQQTRLEFAEGQHKNSAHICTASAHYRNASSWTRQSVRTSQSHSFFEGLIVRRSWWLGFCLRCSSLPVVCACHVPAEASCNPARVFPASPHVKNTQDLAGPEVGWVDLFILFLPFFIFWALRWPVPHHLETARDRGECGT